MATQRIKNKDGEWVLVNNGGGGSTSDIIVDSELSSESTNPIQNKAVAESLKNRPELLEIRYYFGEKELTEEDKAINAASFNTYVTNITNNTKNLYKFFIQNESFGRAESSVEMPDQDSEGNPILQILFGDLYGIFNVTNTTKLLPYIIIIDSTGNIIAEVEMDGPYNSHFSFGENDGGILEWAKRAVTANPYVYQQRPISVVKKYTINGTTYNSWGTTITPIVALSKKFSFYCILDDGYVHSIKLDGTTGYLIEDTIVDTRSNEIAILGNGVEQDIAIINKYSALGCPPLIVNDKLGGGTTIGAYAQQGDGTYYYSYISQSGNIYRVVGTEGGQSNVTLLNRDAVYLFADMQEGDDYAILNTRSMSINGNPLINAIMPEPVICYKIATIQSGGGALQAIPIYPLRVELLNKPENGVNKAYYKYTILGDNFDTIEVWEVNVETGVSALISTTPFVDILGLNTNA